MKKTLALIALAAAVTLLGSFLLESSVLVDLGLVAEVQFEETGASGSVTRAPQDHGRTELRDISSTGPLEEVLDGTTESKPDMGGFRGRILWADGSPAANLSIWIGIEGFFDRQTGKKQMFAEGDPGLSGVLGEGEGMHEVQGFEVTDVQGRFRLKDEEADQGYLWVDHGIGVTEGFDLRGLSSGVELRLQKTGEITIACQGVASRDAWKLSLLPTWRDRQGSLVIGDHILRRKKDPMQSLYIQLTTSGRRAMAREDVTMPVLAGIDYQCVIEGESFSVTKDESLIRSPGRKIFHLEKRHLILPYRILDADGSLSKESAWILVHREGDASTFPAKQTGSQGEISWMDLQAGQKLRVGALLVEGEYIEQVITLLPASEEQQLIFQRGTGIRPWILETALDLVHCSGQFTGSPLLACYSESRGLISGTDFQTWFDSKNQAGFAIMVGGPRIYRLYVPGARTPGKLLCLYRDGRVWLGQALRATREFSVKELASTRLESVDTKAVHKAHGGKLTLSLEIEVHLGQTRQWVALERVQLPTPNGDWPLWEKQVPVAWAARLVLIHNHSQTTHLPLGRR